MKKNEAQLGNIVSNMALDAHPPILWRVLAITDGGKRAYLRRLDTPAETMHADRADLWVLLDKFDA